ncbi:hypothetical protein MMC07_005802 [Pseudocyphellaria aurata]|nr:hypothetical protein [Pseudocyphellaria aurata]
MDNSTGPMKKISEELLEGVRILVTQRDNLREELKYAQSTILELEAQNIRLVSLLTDAQAWLGTAEILPVAKPSTPLMHSIWLTSTSNSKLLGPVEEAWQKGPPEEALYLLYVVLNQENLTNSQRVEAQLLYAAIMIISGHSDQALPQVEDALKIAEEKQLNQLAGKAQFIRGRCCFDLKRYADARWCFALASHTKGYESLIETEMQAAEKLLDQLPAGDIGRSLSLSI